MIPGAYPSLTERPIRLTLNVLVRKKCFSIKGNLVMRFVGNLTTWREILTFDIKKYIRNGGKCNYIPGKNAFFQTLCFSPKQFSDSRRVGLKRVEQNPKQEYPILLGNKRIIRNLKREFWYLHSKENCAVHLKLLNLRTSSSKKSAVGSTV